MHTRAQIEAAAEAIWVSMHRARPSRPGETNLENEWRNIGPNMRRMYVEAAEAALDAADRATPRLKVVRG